ERGGLLAAGRAPGPPDVEEQHLAGVVGGAELFAVEGLARELGGGPTLVAGDDEDRAVARREADAVVVDAGAATFGAGGKRHHREGCEEGPTPHVPTRNLRPCLGGRRCATGSR